MLLERANDIARDVAGQPALGLIKAGVGLMRAGLGLVGIGAQSLSVEDRADLAELLQELITTEDAEARDSAVLAIEEILTPPQGSVRAVKVRDYKPTKWTAFISAKIRELRTASGLTQDELAERSGLRQSHICRLERGEHSPNGLTLEKLAKGLGVPVSNLDPSGKR